MPREMLPFCSRYFNSRRFKLFQLQPFSKDEGRGSREGESGAEDGILKLLVFYITFIVAERSPKVFPFPKDDARGEVEIAEATLS